MAIEKFWAAVPPQAFTVNGTATGVVTIADSALFHVKQNVILASGTQPGISLRVNRIPSSTEIEVGPLTGSIKDRSDVSAYLVADSATITALEQSRPTIGPDDVIRAVYEEEPAVANRTLLVSSDGSYVDLAELIANQPTIDVSNSIDVEWDTLSVTSKDANGNPLVITLEKDSVLSRTLTFTYDVDGDLTTVVKS